MADPRDRVDLTELDVISRYSLAVRTATADRVELVAALRSDLAWLEAGRAARTPARKAAAKPATRSTPARTATARKTTARKTTARKTTARKATARKTTRRSR
jgi:hypothetical protein